MVIVNAGSRTLKLALAEAGGSGRDADEVCIPAESTLEWTGVDASVPEAGAALQRLGTMPEQVHAVGHRIVHGGPDLSEPVELTHAVEIELERWGRWAPAHTPRALAGIRAARSWAPHALHVAVFDTAFHARRDPASLWDPLPAGLCAERGLRRYGFHGIAHAALLHALVRAQGTAPERTDAVTLQLGGGCSGCAIQQGRSIETSMGFSPLGGLPMGTRSGDLDPGVVLELLRDHTPAQLARLLGEESGLAGVAGSGDVRELLRREADGDAASRHALALFVRRCVLLVGSYLTLLGGRGAIVFGGGIGTHSVELRQRIAAGLGAWNVALIPERNAAGGPGCIGAPGTRPVYVFETDEASEIARTTLDLLRRAEPQRSIG